MNHEEYNEWKLSRLKLGEERINAQEPTMTATEFDTIVSSNDIIKEMIADEKASDIFLDKSIQTMLDFGSQKSPYHCYSLKEHTLRALLAFPEDEVRMRRVMFFHDIGKPQSVQIKLDKALRDKLAAIGIRGRDIDPCKHLENFPVDKIDDFRMMFPGHAVRSGVIAKEAMEKMGYSTEEIEKTCFYIAHHDDTIAIYDTKPDYKELVEEKARYIIDSAKAIGLADKEIFDLFKVMEADCTSKAPVARITIRGEERAFPRETQLTSPHAVQAEIEDLLSPNLLNMIPVNTELGNTPEQSLETEKLEEYNQ